MNHKNYSRGVTYCHLNLLAVLAEHQNSVF